MIQVFLLMALSLMAPSHQSDPVLDQMVIFRNQTTASIGVLTTSSGAPVAEQFTGSTLNTNLNANPYFMDTLTRFVRENIPERIVHMKGAGAFGYFEVTENITDICSANFLSEVGKKTPVVARFSVGVTGKGGPDSTATPMGFGIRWYTEEGNFDLLGLNFPLFVLKDPIVFPSFIHVMKRNPSTNVADVNMLWDFASRHPESLFMFLMVFGDRGIPANYISMPCYPVETYQVYNAKGESYFVRFHILPQAGMSYLNSTEAADTACSDLDYYSKHLYRAMANNVSAIWDVNLQILSEEDVKNATFDVFDTSKLLPISQYPLKKIGELVLNKNPTNYFVDIEQLALNPGNFVPGIRGSPSKTFEARLMFYRQAQSYRLGSNYNNIPVNCPLGNKVFTYGRDGRPPASDNGGAAPNYYPNSYNGAEPRSGDNIPSLYSITQDEPDNFDQAKDYYENEMSADERTRFVNTVVGTLCYASTDVQNRTVEAFGKIHSNLSSLISETLESNDC